MSALPIFPGRRQPSIFGANELNFRVRDGNGWTLIAINTDLLVSYECRKYITTLLLKMQAFFSKKSKKFLKSNFKPEISSDSPHNGHIKTRIL